MQGEISSQEGQLLITTWSEFEELEFKIRIKFEAAYKEISSQNKQKLSMLESPVLKQKRGSEVEDKQTGDRCGKISKNAENRRNATRGKKKLLFSACFCC